MKELKLECLVEGYEGTYFEVGQVWETRYGNIKARIIEILTDGHYPIVCEYYDKAGDRKLKFNIDKYGNFIRFSKNRLDLVKLISTEVTSTKSIPTEEPQPKTFSEYLKENNAYESFVENCVNYFLQRIPECRGFSSDNRKIKINNVFYWECTEEGYGYWSELNENRPRNLVYDMNETIFKKINEKISEKSQPESILSEESIPKTFSEYLKENNAYESFVENCVEFFLGNINDFYEYKEDKILLYINNTFLWQDTKEGQDYWSNLDYYIPHNLKYDMNEIIFAEVDKRIAEQKAPTEKTQPEFISTEEFNQMLEQKSTTKYMVFVEGRSNPKKVHDSYDSAEKEAKRLSAKEIGCNVFVVSVVKTFKSKVIVEEI